MNQSHKIAQWNNLREVKLYVFRGSKRRDVFYNEKMLQKLTFDYQSNI